MTCALLALLLGGWGVHKFMMGHTKAGIIQICLIPVCCAGPIIAFIEGIIYLMKTDAEFYQTYIVDKKEWF